MIRPRQFTSGKHQRNAALWGPTPLQHFANARLRNAQTDTGNGQEIRRLRRQQVHRHDTLSFETLSQLTVAVFVFFTTGARARFITADRPIWMQHGL